MMVQNNISNVICPHNLFLPVHVSDNMAMDNEEGYMPSVAWNGFELEWSADNDLCEEFLSSGGRCGHDTKLNKFVCFCPDDSKCPGTTFDHFFGLCCYLFTYTPLMKV